MKTLKSIARFGLAIAIAAPVAATIVPAQADAATARINIQGYTWNDANKNARIDKGEARIKAKKVTLINSRGKAVKTVTTSVSGFYRFAGVAPGTYTVRTSLDSWTGSTLVGTKKSVNAAKGNRDFRGTFKRTTTVSFGFYKVRAAPKPVNTGTTIVPQYTSATVFGDLAGYSETEKSDIDSMNTARKSRGFAYLRVDAALTAAARNTAKNFDSGTNVPEYFQCNTDPSCYVFVSNKFDDMNSSYVYFTANGVYDVVVANKNTKKIGYSVMKGSDGKYTAVFFLSR